MKKKTLILLISLLCIALLVVFVIVATTLKQNTPGNEPNDSQTQQTDPNVETQMQENPTETTGVPNQQGTNPSQSITEPTQSTTGATQPTTGSTQPTTGSTQPTTGATQPTTGSTQPTTGSTQPTTGSTQPTTKPTQPTTGSTQPTTEPTQPTTGSTQPTTGSTQPTTKPTQPTTGSTQPTTEPTQPTTGSTQPTTEPTQPTTGSTQPTTGSTQPTTNPTDPTVGTTEPSEDLEETPPFVEILPDTDPDTGEELPISFPCQIPGYDLIIEKMDPFSGMYVEDGSNASVENVAMLLVRNDGNTPIEYAQISVTCGEEELLFDITALPAGQKLVVQEKNGKSIPNDDIKSATALVVLRTDMETFESDVRVVDNGDNTLTIQNLTDQTIPTIRVFYKYYMEEEALYVGGIAFTVRVTRLGAGASVSISPSHYTSTTSRVVMVLTYDSEV